MRFMVLVPASKTRASGAPPSTEMLAEMQRYNEALVKAGVLLAGDGLRPSSKGARVIFQGSKQTVVGGPFPEPEEPLAGYWIWQVRSREEAIEWLKRAPFGQLGDEPVSVELRQMFDPADRGPGDRMAELRRKEAELRLTGLALNLG